MKLRYLLFLLVFLIPLSSSAVLYKNCNLPGVDCNVKASVINFNNNSFGANVTGTLPAGSGIGEIQFNNKSSFSADSNFLYNSTTQSVIASNYQFGNGVNAPYLSLLSGNGVGLLSSNYFNIGYLNGVGDGAILTTDIGGNINANSSFIFNSTGLFTPTDIYSDNPNFGLGIFDFQSRTNPLYFQTLYGEMDVLQQGTALQISNGSGYTHTALDDQGDLTLLGGLFTNNIAANSLTIPITIGSNITGKNNICLSNGTNCQASSSFNSTNVTYLNQQNTANAPLILGGNITGTKGKLNIGNATSGINQIYFDNTSQIGDGALNVFKGLNFNLTNTEIYVGGDSLFPGYYAQRAIENGCINNSNGNSCDITNLYQGDINDPNLYVNYYSNPKYNASFIVGAGMNWQGRVPTHIQGLVIGDVAVTEPLPLVWVGKVGGGASTRTVYERYSRNADTFFISGDNLINAIQVQTLNITNFSKANIAVDTNFLRNLTAINLTASQTIGIGTTTPQTRLHISLDGSNVNTSTFATATDNIIFSNNASAYFRYVVASSTASSSGGIFAVRTRGNLTIPNTTNDGDVLFTFNGQLYDAASANLRNNAGRIQFVQQGSGGISTGTGGKIVFGVLKPDGLALSNVAEIDNTGNLSVNKTINSNMVSISNQTNSGSDRCTLVSGSCTIANTQVQTGTNIFCFEQTQGGTIGSIGVSGRNAGANYTIASSNVLDTSIVACWLDNPNSL